MDDFSNRRLRNIIPVLTEQRDILDGAGLSFAAHLVDLAVTQLRLTLHDISEDELSEFSSLVTPDRVRSKSLD